MCNFSTGLALGTVVGASIIIALHPMNKRDMRKACHRAERMMDRMSHRIKDWVYTIWVAYTSHAIF